MVFFYFRRRVFAAVLCLFGPLLCLSQTINVNEAILSTADRSYVSFTQGLGNYRTPNGVRPLNPLLFEAQVSPGFFARISEKKSIGIGLFPKIVVRMYNQYSLPVKTPSYEPNFLVYHRVKSPVKIKIFKWFNSENQLTFMTYRLIHRSNGQNGPYYIPKTDSVNYNTGNFSTNAIEAAFSWSTIDSGSIGKAFVNGRIAYERQLELDREINLRNNYYYDKITLESRIIYSNRAKAYITYNFMWGTPKFGFRQSIDLLFSVRPFYRRSDFSVFIRAYAGPDYYNIYYVNTLRAITFGIIADPLNIPILNRLRN